ncbi:probable salivary secreted peptide [Drosophila albomicans]|uniref:Probable salivary secreted peptide n=1 Tax=Drosophila albomicans TaxID=7291 RepID=A0A6P8X3Z1_DROAB|nr:probable salivary secreted peptide [Drosophila albomicans]
MKVYFLAWLVLMSLLALGHAEGDDKKQSHSVTWGARVFRDTHLERVVISEKSRFLRVVTRDYKFKQQSNLKRKITQIVITDQIKEGKGGYAHLRGGGPSASFAEIHFKSQRNRGFSFIVDIYGI